MSDEKLTGQIDEKTLSQGGLRWAGVGSFLFILLQSACTAVMAISGFRVLIGLGALAAASGVYGPAKGFHQDAIRIPMIILALVGALANLYSVWRVRSLRARPAAQWRVQPVSRKKLLSEWVQVALAIVTLILVAAEWITHSMIHRF
jgi:ABC-type xylose transport system permease subunit